MKKYAILAALATVLSGCATTNPYTGESQTSKAVWGTAIGAATGAATGALVSGNRGKGALVGGLAGAAVGGGVGYYLDVQEAELRQELASTGVSVVRDSDSIRLVMPGNITFKTDSADINAGFYATLNSVAKVLNKYSNSTVMVSGYTDSTGSADYNQTLSRICKVKASRHRALKFWAWDRPTQSHRMPTRRAVNRTDVLKSKSFQINKKTGHLPRFFMKTNLTFIFHK